MDGGSSQSDLSGPLHRRSGNAIARLVDAAVSTRPFIQFVQMGRTGCEKLVQLTGAKKSGSVIFFDAERSITEVSIDAP
jgi:hypothetical protein